MSDSRPDELKGEGKKKKERRNSALILSSSLFHRDFYYVWFVLRELRQ